MGQEGLRYGMGYFWTRRKGALSAQRLPCQRLLGACRAWPGSVRLCPSAEALPVLPPRPQPAVPGSCQDFMCSFRWRVFFSVEHL